ncbi:hypothetical protein ACHMW6_06395 [Pseudoduganella sp. UC29_106]|uniref:hypothetical protein n=1 Tax=Pseudoduganella sp. UC29_106 TaxID=3374553 RepID=UPI00375689B0
MILNRIPGDRFSEVSPEWQGETVVILGGGPSLTAQDVQTVASAHECRAVKCIAVNDAYLLASWADVHYAADLRWHAWHSAGIAKPAIGLAAEEVRQRWAAFSGQKCSIENGTGVVADDSVHVLRNAHGAVHGYGLSADPRMLVTGRNSGFQALNLAVLAGAERVILLGFDGKAAPDGRSHWFGEHPESMASAVYSYFRQAMSAAENDLAAAGVEVLNASPGTAIDSFPKVSLRDVL